VVALPCHRLHGLVYKERSPGTKPSTTPLTSAGVPVTKELSGLTLTDGKSPDRLTLMPWQAGKPLTWDFTVVSTLADSHVRLSSQSADSAAEGAADRKTSKYVNLLSDFIYQPLAFETYGATHNSAQQFLYTLDSCMSEVSKESSFLW